MKEIKELDKAGIEHLMQEEGFRLQPYADIKGIPTIAVGNTYYPDGRRVKLTDPAITKERAIEIFKHVLVSYETAVWSVTRDDINQNQFNALVDLAYNIGIPAFKGSTALKRVNNNPKDPRIADAILMWNKPKKLIPRRKRTIALYFS